MLWLRRTPHVSQMTMADQIRVAASNHRSIVLPKRLPSGAGYPLIGEDARPTFAVFGDETRPDTIRMVDADDLAATFGAGVALGRIELQLTNDAVSTGLSKRLPWLSEYRGSLVKATMDSPASQRELSTITGVDFERRGF